MKLCRLIVTRKPGLSNKDVKTTDSVLQVPAKVTAKDLAGKAKLPLPSPLEAWEGSSLTYFGNYLQMWRNLGIALTHWAFAEISSDVFPSSTSHNLCLSCVCRADMWFTSADPAARLYTLCSSEVKQVKPKGRSSSGLGRQNCHRKLVC